jgi:hypothetical protein
MRKAAAIVFCSSLCQAGVGDVSVLLWSFMFLGRCGVHFHNGRREWHSAFQMALGILWVYTKTEDSIALQFWRGWPAVESEHYEGLCELGSTEVHLSAFECFLPIVILVFHKALVHAVFWMLMCFVIWYQKFVTVTTDLRKVFQSWEVVMVLVADTVLLKFCFLLESLISTALFSRDKHTLLVSQSVC